MPRGLPQDTEVVFCFWCRQYHGNDKFCFGTLHHWLGRWKSAFIKWGEKWLERAAWTIGAFALFCLFIALVIALVDGLPR